MPQDFREIVITGATGGLGSDVIAQLQRFAKSSELGVSVRRRKRPLRSRRQASVSGAAISASRPRWTMRSRARAACS